MEAIKSKDKQNWKETGLSVGFGVVAGFGLLASLVDNPIVEIASFSATVGCAFACLVYCEKKMPLFVGSAILTPIAIGLYSYSNMNIPENTSFVCDGAELVQSEDGTTVTPKLPAGCTLAP